MILKNVVDKLCFLHHHEASLWSLCTTSQFLSLYNHEVDGSPNTFHVALHFLHVVFVMCQFKHDNGRCLQTLLTAAETEDCIMETDNTELHSVKKNINSHRLKFINTVTHRDPLLSVRKCARLICELIVCTGDWWLAVLSVTVWVSVCIEGFAVIKSYPYVLFFIDLTIWLMLRWRQLRLTADLPRRTAAFHRASSSFSKSILIHEGILVGLLLLFPMSSFCSFHVHCVGLRPDFFYMYIYIFTAKESN